MPEAGPRRVGLWARLFGLVVRVVMVVAGVVLLTAGLAAAGVATVYYWWPATEALYDQVRGELAWQRLLPLEREDRLAAVEKRIKDLRRANQVLLDSARAQTPEGPYIAVQTLTNTLMVRTADKVMLQAVCSTGSGKVLTTPDGRRTWEFHTPTGVHKVLSKHHFPVWYKPDWAFVEEGEEIPPANSPKRQQEAVLGEYSLNFGNGYMIHGTLYGKADLGRSVTHGCVRLDDLDLEYVYENAPIGTKIFIF